MSDETAIILILLLSCILSLGLWRQSIRVLRRGHPTLSSRRLILRSFALACVVFVVTIACFVGYVNGIGARIDHLSSNSIVTVIGYFVFMPAFLSHLVAFDLIRSADARDAFHNTDNGEKVR